jgi:hypothetical protein
VRSCHRGARLRRIVSQTTNIRQKGLMRRPLSEIIKEMACTLLTDPGSVPSSEAAHVSLLLAHAAWERATRPRTRGPDYHPLLRQFESSNPNLWSELKSADAEALVVELTAYKQAHYSNDRRQIVVCGMRGDNVRVEWIDPQTT